MVIGFPISPEGVSGAASACDRCAWLSRPFRDAGCVPCIDQLEQPGGRGTRAAKHVPRVGHAAGPRRGVIRAPGKAADQVAIRRSDTHLEAAVVVNRDDFLITFNGLVVGRTEDAAGPPRALDDQAQHAVAPRGTSPVSSPIQCSEMRLVPELGARLAALVLRVRRRLLDRQRGAELRQHDVIADTVVGEHARRRGEPVPADPERWRVLEVEQLDSRARTSSGVIADPERDGQTGWDRGQLDRDTREFVALAVVAQHELMRVLLVDHRRGRPRLTRIADQRRWGRQCGRFEDRTERQTRHGLRIVVPVRE